MCDNGRKARRTSSDHDEAYLPENERPRRSMHSSIPSQQRRVQNNNAVARSSTPQLMQTNVLDTHALEQLQSTCSRQQQQLDSVQAAVASLQKDAGRKRKHIQDLRGEVSRKQQRIMSLEQCLQKYQNICSYMVSQSQQLQSGKDYLVSDPESTVSDDYDDDDDDGDDDGDNDGAPGLLTATALDRQAGHAPDNLNVSGLKRTTQDLPTYRTARLCDPRLLPAASGDSAGQLAMQHHQRPYAGGTSHSLGQLDAGGPLGLPKPSIYRRSSGPTQHLGTSSIARGARDAGLPQRLPLRRQQPSPEVRQSQADLGQSQPESRQPRSSQTENTVSHAQMGGSLAEAAAGLLAMTSTDKSQDQPKGVAEPLRSAQQGSKEQDKQAELTVQCSEDSTNSDMPVYQAWQAGGPVPKRASWLITARHPQTPDQIQVICKQLTGTLLVGRPGQYLTIRPDASQGKLLSPPDFEATAGCSKSKNWKANIKVHGSNGRCQMLKLWLPGLLQLGGDHVRKALASETHIEGLLDVHTGLRSSTA